MDTTTIPDHGAFAAMSNDISQGGLSKREYFAAQALTGLLAHTDGGGYSMPSITQSAVDFADELIKSLNQTPV